eukprot:2584051-Pyramimonas_sp.AAC.1
MYTFYNWCPDTLRQIASCQAYSPSLAWSTNKLGQRHRVGALPTPRRARGGAPVRRRSSCSNVLSHWRGAPSGPPTAARTPPPGWAAAPP